jgi:diaminopimelate epimerase
VEAFFKYQALGNDFLILDRRSSARDIGPEAARALCDRRRGVGADGVLVLLPASSDAALARMVVHNADGSVAEMCGNGLRCVVKHLAEAGRAHPQALAIETGAGVRSSELSWTERGVELVTVAMGPAQLELVRESIDGFTATAVNMGNPHLVLLDANVADIATLGPRLEAHPRFPHRTNVEACRLEPDGKLTTAVWERGVGLTQACGTGACACVVAFAREGRVPFEQWVKVALPGGVLEVKAAADLSSVSMRGPATFVFQGSLP